MKFQIGDRVRVYMIADVSIGNVLDVDESDNTLHVDTNEYGPSWYHAKQCRKLKPKPVKQKTKYMTFSEALDYLVNSDDGAVTYGNGFYFTKRTFLGSSYSALIVHTAGGRTYEWRPNQQELLEYKYRIIE